MLRVLFLACCLLCPSVVYADAFGVEMGSKAEKYGIAENPSLYMYILKNVPKPHAIFYKYAVLDTPKNGICSLQAQTQPLFLAQIETLFDKLVKNIIEKYGGEKKETFYKKDGLSQFFNYGFETNAVIVDTKKDTNIERIIISKFKINDRLSVIVLIYHFKNIKKWLDEYNEMWREAF